MFRGCRILAKKKAIINIQNVVATATLGRDFDLDSILRLLLGAEYRPEVFPGLVYGLKEPKTATLLFRTGKMVCTGAKKEEQVHEAVEKLQKELEAERLIHYE